MEAAEGISPPPPPGLVCTPVELMTRAEATWLVLLPLKRLLASTPLSRKLFEVSRWPLAQMGALPSPELAPVPLLNSAVTPVDWVARPVKLPVGSGTDSISDLSKTYPTVVSTTFINGEASTSTVVVVWPILSATFTVAVRLACTVMCCVFCTSKPSAV